MRVLSPFDAASSSLVVQDITSQAPHAIHRRDLFRGRNHQCILSFSQDGACRARSAGCSSSEATFKSLTPDTSLEVDDDAPTSPLAALAAELERTRALLAESEAGRRQLTKQGNVALLLLGHDLELEREGRLRDRAEATAWGARPPLSFHGICP
jgi:hypothetical protein